MFPPFPSLSGFRSWHYFLEALHLCCAVQHEICTGVCSKSRSQAICSLLRLSCSQRQTDNRWLTDNRQIIKHLFVKYFIFLVITTYLPNPINCQMWKSQAVEKTGELYLLLKHPYVTPNMTMNQSCNPRRGSLGTWWFTSTSYKELLR